MRNFSRIACIALALLSPCIIAGQYQNNVQQFQPYNDVPSGVAPPADPSGALTIDNDAALVTTWTDNSSDEDNFEVYVSVDGGAYSLVATEAANATSSTYSSQTAGHSYTFKVRAINDGVGSGYATATAVQTPVFAVNFGTGSITPALGTAGTFARASVALMPTLNALVAKSSGAELVEAFPTNVSYPQGGYYATGAVKNWMLRSNEFDNASWVKTGTATVTADAVNGPQGNADADRLIGAAANDSVEQDTGFLAASMSAVGSVWLRANSGSRTVTLRLRDNPIAQSGTKACTVTSVWTQCTVQKIFTGGGAGNVFFEIIVNDTTGYSIFAAEAFVTKYVASQTDGMAFAQALTPSITTTNATVTKAIDDLQYAGSEVRAADAAITIVVWLFIPTYDGADLNNFITYFNNFTNAWGAMQALRLRTADDTLQPSFGDDSYTNTSLQWVKNRWNMVTIAVDYTADQHYISVNGGTATTATDSVNARATTALVIGNINTSANTRNAANTIFGRVRRYNVKLTTTENTAIYNALKADYGL